MSQLKERVAYLNGEIIPESQAKISILDRGFRWGDGVYDVERTFGGQIFKLREHIRRIYRSMKYCRIDPGMPLEEMERLVLEVVERNRPLLGPREDYLVWQVVSRGVSSYILEDPSQATVVISCELMHFEYARFYKEGARLVTPATRRTPLQSLSPKGKITNKMNHLQAYFEARDRDPEAIALMLDTNGNIAESPSANFFFVADGVLKFPHRRNVLQGISMETTLSLARGLGIPIEEDDYQPWDVYQADEAFLTTSTYCVLPVASLNGSGIGDAIPGPITQRLLDTWQDMVGFDFVGQAMSWLPAQSAERG